MENLKSEEEEDKLGQFFGIIGWFNESKPFKRELKDQIVEFIGMRNKYNKNCFLNKPQYQHFMSQLPESCQINIYAKFLFKDFLFKFRFFFNIRNSYQDFPLNKRSKQNQPNVFKVKALKYKKIQFSNGKIGLMGKSFPYPFYTFDDQSYSRFMVEMLNSLEFRYYHKDIIFINELDECLEMLFVEKGLYQVGYQINNNLNFVKTLGVFSIIGGYQICHRQRFEFIYRSKTQIQGQAIRCKPLLNLLQKWPQFKHQIYQKLRTQYSQSVFQPLSKQKNIDQKDYTFRRDYQHVICLKNRNLRSFLKDLMNKQMYSENKERREVYAKILHQRKINNLILNIEKKFQQICQYSLSITERTEKFQKVLNQRITTAIARGQVGTNKQEIEYFIEDFHEFIFDYNMQITMRMLEMKSFEDFKF